MKYRSYYFYFFKALQMLLSLLHMYLAKYNLIFLSTKIIFFVNQQASILHRPKPLLLLSILHSPTAGEVLGS